MQYPYTPLHMVSSRSFLHPSETFQASYGNVLPHWNIPKLQYVTFRLADSLPQIKLQQFIEMKEQWKEEHPKPWSEDVMAEYSDAFGDKIDKWLDAGMGQCLLRDVELREIVIDSLFYDEGVKYDVMMFCIMPNHVHLLLNVYDGVDISVVCKNMKHITAIKINKRLGRTGSVWMRESFDRVIRSEKHFSRVYEYIKHNGDNLDDSDYTVMV